jgi:hypothetical protein
VSAVFSEKEVVDLTIAIGLMNTYNRIAIGFRHTPEAALAHKGKPDRAESPRENLEKS